MDHINLIFFVSVTVLVLFLFLSTTVTVNDDQDKLLLVAAAGTRPTKQKGNDVETTEALTEITRTKSRIIDVVKFIGILWLPLQPLTPTQSSYELIVYQDCTVCIGEKQLRWIPSECNETQQ